MVLACVVARFARVGADDGAESSESGGGGVAEAALGIERERAVGRGARDGEFEREASALSIGGRAGGARGGAGRRERRERWFRDDDDGV